MAAKALKDMGMARVSHLETGFNGWRDAGQPVVDHDAWKAEQAKSEE